LKPNPGCRPALVVLLTLIAGLFLACGLKPSSDDVAAVVDGQKIYRADLEKYFQNQTAGSNQPLSDEQATSLRLSILRELIENEILMHRAEKLGLLATDDEMEAAKNALVQRLPSRFSSVSGVGGAISALYLNDLPEDYYQRFAASVNAVTKEDVVRVARKYIDPDHLAIVIVGDRKEIQKPLEALKIAPIVLLDLNGNPIVQPVRP